MHVKEVWGFESGTSLKIPLFTARVSAGFPSRRTTLSTSRWI